MKNASQENTSGAKANVTASPVKAAHTPLPWKAARVHPEKATADALIEIFPMVGGVHGGWNSQSIACMFCAERGSIQEANAELIVRAVNNHDALTAFAERVGRLNPDAGEIGAGMLVQLVTEARALADAATLA